MDQNNCCLRFSNFCMLRSRDIACPNSSCLWFATRVSSRHSYLGAFEFNQIKSSLLSTHALTSCRWYGVHCHEPTLSFRHCKAGEHQDGGFQGSRKRRVIGISSALEWWNRSFRMTRTAAQSVPCFSSMQKWTLWMLSHYQCLVLCRARDSLPIKQMYPLTKPQPSWTNQDISSKPKSSTMSPS